MGSPLMLLYVDGFPFEWMMWFLYDEIVLIGSPWRSGAFILFGLISLMFCGVWRRCWVPLGVHTGWRLQGVRQIVPTNLHFSFMPSGDWGPWIRALGCLSDNLSERDPTELLIRARIGQVDGFPSMEPSTMVLSLRFWIGRSSCQCFGLLDDLWLSVDGYQ